MSIERIILLLGLGNILMRDDGVGIHALKALEPWPWSCPGVIVRARDGGTLGLSLLPEVQDSDSLIVLDATHFGGAPGSVKTFEGAEMDRQLSGTRHSVHELALADLLAAAEFMGGRPSRRALIGVQPESIDWGLTPTDAVAGALPEVLASARELVERWSR